MRVECTHCKQLTEVAGLTAVPGGLGFACTACGGTSLLAPVVAPAAVPAPAAAAASTPAAAPSAGLPEGHAACPKCGQVYAEAGAEACARCGLVFAKVADGTARLAGPPAVLPALRGRWQQLSGALDDESGHHAFIEACAAHEALEFAGHCYRSLTPPGQAEDPRVSAYRERVLRQAVARVQMFASPKVAAEQQGDARKLALALVAAFVLLIFAVGYWYTSTLTQKMQLLP